jgi:hypothetical protein
VPEREKEYPEPSMFGLLPAYGLYIRHADGVSVHNLAVTYAKDDSRPAFVLDTARNVQFEDLKWQKSDGTPSFVLRTVENVTATRCTPGPDFKVDHVADKVVQ